MQAVAPDAPLNRASVTCHQLGATASAAGRLATSSSTGRSGCGRELGDEVEAGRVERVQIVNDEDGWAIGNEARDRADGDTQQRIRRVSLARQSGSCASHASASGGRREPDRSHLAQNAGEPVVRRRGMDARGPCPDPRWGSGAGTFRSPRTDQPGLADSGRPVITTFAAVPRLVRHTTHACASSSRSLARPTRSSRVTSPTLRTTCQVAPQRQVQEGGAAPDFRAK